MHRAYVLSSHFQSDLVDIASISGYADATLQNLHKKLFRDSTCCGSKYLQNFVEQSKNGDITFSDISGDVHVHKLNFDHIKGSNRVGTFGDCKHYPSEELEMDASSKAWLRTILSHYGTLVDDVEKCMGEMDAFTMVLASNFKCKGFCDAWEVCRDDVTMRDFFPNMMKLWEILSVVLVNIAIAKCGFSLQNIIKIAHRTSMSVTTLENYMFIGLHGPQNASNVPWDDAFSLWCKKKKRTINTSA
ncbi:hypothetical protein L7F22_025740 [Adiantum nelumboides]|nr:hypothetical protein [Adiantum nelumboides]